MVETFLKKYNGGGKSELKGRKSANMRDMAMIAAALWAFCTLGMAKADVRIPLRPDMLINESAIGDASKMVDEQTSIGDPASGKGLKPVSPFFPGWTSWEYPISVVIDLGAPCPVTRLFIYNNTGSAPIRISTGGPLSWKTETVTLDGYLQWKEFPLNVTTRYIRITLLQPTSIYEIALYGQTVPNPPSKPSRVPEKPHVQPTMDQFIGTNAFIDDPVKMLSAAVGYVREYHDWTWDTEGADHLPRYEPSGAAGGDAWFFDDYYRQLKRSGVTVCPAIQQSDPVYFPGASLDSKPIPKGANPEDPVSYAIHAQHLYQYAARYGDAHVPDSKLILAPGQPRLSGLGVLRYIENWNEPDGTWHGRDGWFSPFDLAAMCSADYDGNQGRMGKEYGVKNADPHMRLVMGGLADGLNLEYLKAMKFWADVHRHGDFPADVINLHHYSNDGTPEQPFRNQGISPEADHIRAKFAKIVRWCHANIPKCQVWVSEFGYDTNPRSPIHAPAIGSYTSEEVQAIWLVRSYLELAAAGVDRAAMFMFRDVKTDGTGVFETCGMVTEKGQWKPKPSYYYIATLKNRLKGMRFANRIPSGKDHVRIYRFAGKPGDAYVVWCDTSDDLRVRNVSFRVGGASATRIDFKDGEMNGLAAPIPVKDGVVSLDAREKPVIIMIPKR